MAIVNAKDIDPESKILKDGGLGLRLCMKCEISHPIKRDKDMEYLDRIVY